jgi:hypothetical protein
VLGEEGGLRQRGIVGEAKALAGIGAEVLGDGALRQRVAESWRQNEAQVVVERDQVAVRIAVSAAKPLGAR